ncbi:MAG: CfrBI family restriction endonuclease [Clostridiales bacterium]|nr:CfrBI family restriction endonuclease [Clostridiales bacterium]
MDYLVEQYNSWLDDNIALTNAFSEESMRQMAIQLLLGKNYRLITENNTKSKLALTYLWLSEVVKNAQIEFGQDWKVRLVDDLNNVRHRTPEQDNLMFWLAGLTKKNIHESGRIQK